MQFSLELLAAGTTLFIAGSASAYHNGHSHFHVGQKFQDGDDFGNSMENASWPNKSLPTPSVATMSEVLPTTALSGLDHSSSSTTSIYSSSALGTSSALQSDCTQRSAYGSVVDAVDTIPSTTTKPSTLPTRADGNLTVTGHYSDSFVGSLGGDYMLFYNGQNVTLSGTGYFQVRWEVAWFNRGGIMVMPTWTGLRGVLIHVASGGGRVMTDTHPGTNCTYMGVGCGHEVISLPRGALQMWQNEYYWIDGTVTLHENEGSADYNLGVTPVKWEVVNKDINKDLNVADSVLRYGMTRDTGDYCGPVPQYVTSNATTDRDLVGQKSEVSLEKQ